MIFTDDDLARLKARKHPQRITKPLIVALLARLEAAEKCIPYHECQDDLSTCPHLKAWRKAKGIDPESLAEWARKAAGK